MLDWFLLLSGLLVLGIGCLIPARYLPPLPNDKLLHFAAFALLTLIATRLTHTPQQTLAASFALLILGWVIECVQNWIPGRTFCWRDIAANAAGIACALVVVFTCEYFFH